MKLRRNLILTAFGLLLAATVAHADQKEWDDDDGGNDHVYEVVVEARGISWPDAKAAAEARGGYLATITSAEENEFVFDMVNNEKYWGDDGYNGYGPWIGAYQDPEAEEPADGWKWVTDEAWEFDVWSPGAAEPNDGDGFEDHGEDHAHYFAFGQLAPQAMWNDSNAQSPNVIAYIIEWNDDDNVEMDDEDLDDAIDDEDMGDEDMDDDNGEPASANGDMDEE